MLLFDPQSGVSGDMLLSSLVSVGADQKKIRRALRGLCEIEFLDVRKAGINAKRMRYSGEGRFSPKGMEKEIARRLKGNAKKFAMRALAGLVDAERKVHRNEDVHFHELGDVDTLIDIIGTAAALECIGEKEILSLPANAGKVAPATAEIFRARGFPFRVGGKFELATPTGAALLTSIAEPVEAISIKAEKIGYGAGEMELKEPNVLRVMKGKRIADGTRVLETNVDDVSGEVVGYAAQRLLREGGKDVGVIPVFAKKGRPAYMIQVVCDSADVERLVRILVEETGTLGVREYVCRKHAIERKISEGKTKFGNVRVKMGSIGGKVVTEKIEYEDARKLAEKSGKPLREILESAKRSR